MFRTAILSTIFALTGGAAALAQPVAGRVDAAGFGAANTTNHIARLGQWIPILCDLQVQLGRHFEGELSCEAVDLDGDRVSFKHSPLVLTAGGSKRVWLYVSSLGPSAPEQVDVIGKDGVTITSLDLPEIAFLPDTARLVLDISARRISLDVIDETSRILRGDDSTNQKHYRGIVRSRMPANQLPDQWWGLEAVNVIVWDKPNPADLNVAQMNALIRWVRNGGQLVVGLGEAWAAVRTSLLADILPLEGAQPSIIAQQLQRVRPTDLYKGDAVEFEMPIAICAARRVKTRGAITAHARLVGMEPINLILSETVGNGRVTTLLAGISDLMKPMDAAGRRRFFRQCFDLNEMQPAWVDLQNQTFLPDREKPLFGRITASIDFSGIGQLFRIAAIAFVVAYILLSTFATWWWLKRRSMTGISWTAFAACAVVASALGLATVAMTRGFSKVRAVTVYDLQSDSKQAGGPCWFGYRSPTRQRVDLTLPGDQNYLRALSLIGSGSEYATPQRYAAFASQSLLSDTLMRASLKQFEGYWVGELDGTVRLQLQAERADGRIADGRGIGITNDLPVNIISGWLLYMDPRLPRDAPNKPAGYEINHESKPTIPAKNVLAIKIPGIRAGDRTVGRLGEVEYQAYDTAMRRYDPTRGREPPELLNLRTKHLNWMANIGALTVSNERQFISAVMLASTRNLYLPLNKKLDGVNALVDTTGLIDMDITHWLTKDQAVLILFSDQPGPATLHRDDRPMKSSSGYSVYRVRVPLSLRGQLAPRGGSSP